ncbi:ParA family protein [Ligilactobacillus sp. LYQ135]
MPDKNNVKKMTTDMKKHREEQKLISKEKAFFENKSQATVITIGNQKGGVGKTTNVYLISYVLAKFGIKTLVVDLDPQSNSTKTLMLTKSENQNTVDAIDKTIMRGVEERDFTDLPVNIKENLDLLPSYIDFENFTKYLYKNTNSEYEETHLIEPLLEPLKANYDVILLDVPPLNIEITKNAVVCSDYVLISLQTQEDSMSGAESYINTLVKLKEQYNLPVEVIGILAVLSEKRSPVDKLILKSAAEEFGEDILFKTIVPQMARIKRFPIKGITDSDFYDKKVIDVYKKITHELIERLIDMEREDN